VDRVYQEIGRTYTTTRVEDPRVARTIHAGLGDARRIVNVGAGTGNYEPVDREVVAVEPAPAMIAQRAGRPAPVVCAAAEALPLPTGSFDAALAILTLHHWDDLHAGLRELRRVARRQVIFYFEPLATHGFWALDYFPEAVHMPVEAGAPGLDDLAMDLEVQDVVPILVPKDCTDGFGVAFWARPEAYLDPVVQAGMSWLALLPQPLRDAGSARLRADLHSGEWHRRHGHLLDRDEYDGGYRLALCGG